MVTLVNTFYNGMCLFDYSNQSTSNNVFAVRFDSYRETFLSTSPELDPSDGNIGVVITNQGVTTVTRDNLCPPTSIQQCYFFHN